jgi:hypothetical protein
VPPRLDNDVGTGIHLSPGGIEFDERRLTLGKNTEVSRQDAKGFIALIAASACHLKQLVPPWCTVLHLQDGLNRWSVVVLGSCWCVVLL